MQTFTGYHGTRLDLAHRILREGFSPSTGEADWLGHGIYFFEDIPSIANGLQEAKGWAIKVRKYTRWAVIKAEIECKTVLDLVSDQNSKRHFEVVRQKMLAQHRKYTRDKEFHESVIFSAIDRATSFDCVRSLVDGGRMEYTGYVVRRPQIQLCVKDIACIRQIWIEERSVEKRNRNHE